MNVVEIFLSIDGEGIRAGELATFVRLAGCNLRCSYCDTKYAQGMADGEEMSALAIIDRVKELGCKNVTLTGGEPLLNKDGFILAHALAEGGYSVNIETNGSIDIGDLLDEPNVIITMDYKCPSSGCEESMCLSNLEKLREQDVLKFVLEASDFDAVRAVIARYKINAQIYLSPVFGRIEPVQIVDFMKREFRAKNNIRVQLQLHKFIWPPEMRGV